MKLRLALTAILFCIAGGAAAQAFPGKPVRIVPFGTAGGPVDIIARLYAERLRARWSQPVIVEAKPGASGTLAADLVAKAPPDGTTFLITLSLTHINNVVVQKNIPYDPFRDFEPLSQLAVGYGPALIAPAGAPFSDLRELIAYAKRKPAGLTYGTWGTGSTPHLFSELLARQAGVQLVHVPYKGEAAAHLDLFAGALDLAWANTGTARTHLVSHKVKVLGATGSKRSDVLPDTPLFGEQGFSGFELTTWIGAYAPARTRPAVVSELSAALREATRAPEIAARWRDIGFEPTGTTSEEFARIHKADFPKWTQMIQAAGITPE
ncbi:MAG TPA: tripartite tricarboxylate transporter substrate binding protein [Burkholderiales bacterium]|nr:tripartite tricarboxylate transporter substrate binding protein [Burkholderiales bacterium]